MAKRPRLFDTPPARSAVPAIEALTETASSQTAPDMTSEGRGRGRQYPVSATREGKRAATCYLNDEALHQLKMIALNERTTVQALLLEGINAVFEKRGKSRLA